jgi:hypothetical protein
MDKLIYAKNRIRRFYYSLKTEWEEKYCRYMPKIKNKFPDAPCGGYCPKCYKPLRICAYNTGDGWYFWWDCENEHWLEEDITKIIDWFPFVFGWCSGNDLRKIGIEEK